jgi:hypothetical protein
MLIFLVLVFSAVTVACGVSFIKVNISSGMGKLEITDERLATPG